LRLLKEYKINDAALLSRASKLLDRGYKRLLRYEIQGGGFEWFGNGPAHESLTAYGLLQFTAMKKVYPVSEALLSRTRQWLLSRRDGKGGFLFSSRAYGAFGRASHPVHHNYITYALAESGARDIKQELKIAQEYAKTTHDPYLLALALLATQHLQGATSPQAKALLDTLLTKRQANGSFLGSLPSFTGSRYTNLAIETTSLALLSMIRAKISEIQLAPSASFLQQQRSMYGRYGSTQATVLALQALAALERAHPTPKSDEIAILASIDDQPFLQRSFHPQHAPIHSIKQHIPLRNKHNLRLQLTGKARLPFQAHASFYTYSPPSHPQAPVKLNILLDKQRLRLSQIARLTATLTNQEDQPQAMTLARIAFPGGLTPQIWQLKELREKNIVDFYEIHPRELVVYLRQMNPREKRTLHLDLVAHVTGNYTAPASSAYPYYTNERAFWHNPLRVSIIP
jgi:hypothetical protein